MALSKQQRSKTTSCILQSPPEIRPLLFVIVLHNTSCDWKSAMFTVLAIASLRRARMCTGTSAWITMVSRGTRTAACVYYTLVKHGLCMLPSNNIDGGWLWDIQDFWPCSLICAKRIGNVDNFSNSCWFECIITKLTSHLGFIPRYIQVIALKVFSTTIHWNYFIEVTVFM